jgi:hypothetical protein
MNIYDKEIEQKGGETEVLSFSLLKFAETTIKTSDFSEKMEAGTKTDLISEGIATKTVFVDTVGYFADQNRPDFRRDCDIPEGGVIVYFAFA